MPPPWYEYSYMVFGADYITKDETEKAVKVYEIYEIIISYSNDK